MFSKKQKLIFIIVAILLLLLLLGIGYFVIRSSYNFISLTIALSPLNGSLPCDDIPLDIIYEDKELIAINKPSGLLTVSTDKEKEKTLYREVADYEKKKHKSNKVFIINRLDKDTSGIVVLAKDEKTKNQLQENWNEYVSLREYVAVVHGHLKESSGRVVQKLLETKKKQQAFKEAFGKTYINEFKDYPEEPEEIIEETEEEPIEE